MKLLGFFTIFFCSLFSSPFEIKEISSNIPFLQGAYVGKIDDSIFIAGGIKESGEYSNAIYRVIEHGEGFHLERLKITLPKPIANGSTVSTEQGLLFIGGEDGEKGSQEVLSFYYSRLQRSYIIRNMQPVPVPTAYASAERIGNYVYLLGGRKAPYDEPLRYLWRYRIDSNHWDMLPSLPGPSRALSMTTAQSNGNEICLYVFGGLSAENQVLGDAYSYIPSYQIWREELPLPTPMFGGSGVSLGANNIIITGKPIEDESTSISAFFFHTLTKKWAAIKEFNLEIATGTKIVTGKNKFLLFSGSKEGKVFSINHKPVKGLGKIAFVILGAYFLMTLCIGWIFSGNEETSQDYFKAGKRIPWWAAGLSVYGTAVSSMAFLAMPGKAFAQDWQLLAALLALILIAPLISHAIIPIYRRLDVTSIYEYLEKRFDVVLRLWGSLCYSLYQIIRIGMTLYLPAVAFSVMSGVSVDSSIILVTVFSIIYTVLGGIEAVIWTDVIQTLLIFLGLFVVMAYLIISLPVPFLEGMSFAASQGKFHILNFDRNIIYPTFWVVIFGNIIEYLYARGFDQSVAQRFMTTKTTKEAQKTLLIYIPLNFLSYTSFLFVVTLLFIFYSYLPEKLDPTLPFQDGILPYFAMTELSPFGASLVIAGVFSAAMSSLDSSMNSTATVFVIDFYKRFRKDLSEHETLKLAKKWTIGIGLIGMVTALIIARAPIVSLLDKYASLIGIFTGTLTGIFLLGMFTKKAHTQGVILGSILGTIIGMFCKHYTIIHFYLFPAISGLCTVLFGYLISLITKSKEVNLSNLTIYTLRKEETTLM